VDIAALSARLAALPDGPVLTQEATRRAAIALLLREGAGGSEVLLMRRAERDGDRWSGQIGLPGGHADPADRDLLETARREAREEVGLDLEREAELVGRLVPVQAKARGYLLPMWITPFVFAARGAPEPRVGPEAVEAFWFPLERARRGDLAWTHRYRRETEERVLPAWRFEERVVWGLTYEILSGFLALLPASG